MWSLMANVIIKVLSYGLILILGLLCWLQWKKWHFLQAARKLPCIEKPLPIVGHAHYLLGGWEAYTKFMIETYSMGAVSKGLYNVCKWIGPVPLIMIHKSEDIQKILNTSCAAEKAHEYDYLKYAAGNGLLTAPVHIWKLTRRHISPLFHQHNVEQLMSVFNSNSRELVADLAQHVDKEPVDMLHPAMSVALKTVCQLIFGTELEFDSKSKAFRGLLRSVERVPALFTTRTAIPLLRPDFIFNFIYRKELNEIDKIWTEFTNQPLKVAKNNQMKKQCDSSCNTINEQNYFTDRELFWTCVGPHLDCSRSLVNSLLSP